MLDGLLHRRIHGHPVCKLERLAKCAPWIYDRLDHFYDRRTAVGLVGKVVGFRLMHLHGRALQLLLPKAVDRVEDYFWADGELIAGLVLGWNFGDRHLHREQLLAVQAQCGYEPGELRCIFVESQPLFGSSLEWRIHDAAAGLVAEGHVEVAWLLELQPWPEEPATATADDRGPDAAGRRRRSRAEAGSLVRAVRVAHR